MVELEDKLESLMDSHGLAAVLSAMASVCAAKAEHVSANYPQCKDTIKLWNEMAVKLDRLSVVSVRLS